MVLAYEDPRYLLNLEKVLEREPLTTDKEQSNFQGSTAQIPPPVIPISIPEPDVPKTLPKTTPILEPDVPKNLPKPNIPYPSRLNQEKSRDKASNQKEKIFQMFQDLRFDISFADALLLMPRFAPTIKSLLMNKEKLLELAKIPLNENCSAMLLKKLPEKLGDPGKFLIPCNFPRMDIDQLLILKKFTDEPTLVCLPPSEDDNDKKEKHEVKNLAESTAKRQTRITPCLKNFRVICKESVFHSNKTPQVSSVFAITSTLPSIVPKESIIMGDEHLSTFSVEEIVPILRESEDTSGSKSENVLPSCDDFSSFNAPRDNSVTFSNPLFEFDVNFNSSNINPLFDKVLEDIECKDSYLNLDESTFLVKPLSDSNKDEWIIDDPLFEENDDLFDLECKTNDWKRILYDAPIDKAECFDPGGDNDKIEAFLAIEVPTYIEEGYYDSEGDVLYLAAAWAYLLILLGDTLCRLLYLMLLLISEKRFRLLASFEKR
ncbi:hypothetical protein Tco_0199787 [Tanacetum coccineum]